MAQSTDSGQTDNQESAQQRNADEVLFLIDVFSNLPTQALIIVLKERGFAAAASLAELDRLYLVALAVYTHRPGWELIPRRRADPTALAKQSDAPVMLDIAI